MPVSAVKELTRRELDAAVAERVMGYRWIVINQRRKNFHAPNGHIVAFVEGKETHYTGYQQPELPEFSLSIEAAMLVIEKMRESSKWCCINLHADFNYVWKVSFTRAEPRNEEHKQTAFAVNESLPMAICQASLAALTAVEREKQNGD